MSIRQMPEVPASGSPQFAGCGIASGGSGGSGGLPFTLTRYQGTVTKGTNNNIVTDVKSIAGLFGFLYYKDRHDSDIVVPVNYFGQGSSTSSMCKKEGNNIRLYPSCDEAVTTITYDVYLLDEVKISN